MRVDAFAVWVKRGMSWMSLLNYAVPANQLSDTWLLFSQTVLLLEN